MRVLAVLATAMVVLGGCGSSDGASPPRATERAASADAAATSGAGTDMVDHVVSRDEAFAVSCATADLATFGSDVGLSRPDDRFDRAVQVKGGHNVLALHVVRPLDACPHAEWILVYGDYDTRSFESTAERARDLCLLPAQPDDPRCHAGGPFWVWTDPSQDGTAGDGRSAVWVEPAAAVDDSWRKDPLEVAARQVGVDGEVPAFYQLRRVGLRIVDETDDRIVVEAVYIDRIDNNGTPWGTIQREHHTLTRLGGREGWFEDEFIVAAYGKPPTDDHELDAAWHDIDRVLVDVDRR